MRNALGSGLIYKQLSQYEGEKRAYEKLWSTSEAGGPQPHLYARIQQAEGARRPEPNEDFLCAVCKIRKKNFRLVRCHVTGMGERVKNMRGHYVKACESCAEALGTKLERRAS